MKITMKLASISMLIGFLAVNGCTQIANVKNEGENYNRSHASQQATIRTSAYSFPFEITYDRLRGPLSGQDSICVVDADDYTNGKKIYKNSGSLITKELYTNFSQYSLATRRINTRYDNTIIQNEARSLGCNLIAMPKVDSWSVDMLTLRDMRVSLQMFDTNTWQLVNSFAINASSEDDILAGITYLIHKLYFPN